MSTIVLALTCALVPVGAQDTRQRVQQTRAQLEALQEKIDQVRASIRTGHERHEELAAQLDAAGRAVRKAVRRLQEQEQDIADLEQQIDRLQDEHDAELTRLEQQLDTLRTQIRAAYRTGRTSKLRMLLSGNEPARIGRMLVYYEYFTHAQSRQVAQLRDALADLTDRRAELEAKRQQLAEQRDAHAATLAHLKSSRGQRKAAMAALEERLSEREATLQDYRDSAAQLESMLSTLKDRLARPAEQDPAAFTALKGHMDPPVEGAIIARFGAPKAHGKLQWRGQWRAAPHGRDVRAVADGRVVYIGYLHHYGLIVVLNHAGDYFTVYGHTQGSYVEVGDIATRGQPIARAGTSGGHDRSGVYFEIRKGTQALDPSQWFAG